MIEINQKKTSGNFPMKDNPNLKMQSRAYLIASYVYKFCLKISL